MAYGFLTIASLLFSVQFLFQKQYQGNEGDGAQSSFLFAGIVAVIALVYLPCMSGFVIEFSPFSFGLSVIAAANTVVGTYFGVKALKYANMSTFSLFMMLGGVILPFLAGVTVFGETTSWAGYLSCLLIVAALAVENGSVKEKENKKKTVLYCAIAFVTNGLSGVLAKTHQAFPHLAASSQSYLFFTNAVVAVFVACYFLIGKCKPIPAKPVSLLYCGLYAAATTVGNLLVLLSLQTLAASVQYTFLTAVTLVFSFAVSWIFLKEKKNGYNALSLAIAALSAVLLYFG